MRSALLFGLLTLLACNRVELKADGCPKDLLAARGQSCSEDGKTCSVGSEVRLLMCSKGKWTELNVPPAPR